jgi:hypothetical protein
MRKIATALVIAAMTAVPLILTSSPALATTAAAQAPLYIPICPAPHNCNSSPIIIDVDGSGFHLTSAAHGVRFDFFGNRHPIQMAWIAPGSTNAFLVLPRAGRVTNGTELFGNITPQPASSDPNGFLALASMNALTGGRDTGVINSHDPIYYKLRLWQFTSYDGVVGEGRLSTLPELGIKAIYLNFQVTNLTDRYGNQFRYRARIVSSNPHAGKYAYDVFFATAATSAPRPAAVTRPGTTGIGLLSALALLLVVPLLSIRPLARRRRRTGDIPEALADDAQPVAPQPQFDVVSKS